MPIFVGFGAVAELIVLVIGHAVLKWTDIPAYQNNSIVSSAQVGAAGGALMVLPLILGGAVLNLCLMGMTQNARVLLEGQRGINVIMGLSFPLGAAAIGREILSKNNHPVMDHLDYVKAGLLGSTVFGAASGVVVLVIFLTCGCGCALWAGWNLKSLRPTRIPKAEKASKTIEDMEMGSSTESMLSTTSKYSPLSTL